ncbi:MAG: DUF4389 domain-containing protein [Thermoleophilia bacterium]
MRAGRIVLVVLGALAVLVSLGLLAGGGFLLWAHETQRDAEGYYSTVPHRFESTGYAVLSEGVDLEGDGAEWAFGEDRIGTVRLRVDSSDRPVFVGIGPERDVLAYLDGVARDRIRDVDVDPFRVSYERFEGGAPGSAPGQQEFWVARAEGASADLRWTIDGGDWVAVLMNADGSAAVGASVALGARVPVVLPLAIGLLVGGGVLLVLGSVLIVLGARGGAGTATASPAAGQPPAYVPVAGTEAALAEGTTIAPGAGAAPGGPAAASAPGGLPPATYPVNVEAALDEPLSRWLWLVKWLLAIPHWLILALLWVGFAVVTVIAFFAILITGRYPRGLFDFNVGVMRWTWRVSYYSYGQLATDRYPPFSLGPEPDYPATLDVEYPERLHRGLVLVKWLLVIPHAIVVGIFVGGWGIGRTWFGGGLVGLIAVIAGIVLLVTGRYPRPLWDVLTGFNRWTYRVIAYAGLMRDEYPPFRLER